MIRSVDLTTGEITGEWDTDGTLMTTGDYGDPGSGLGYPGVEFTEKGLVLPENLPLDDWLGVMHSLIRVERGIQWAIGDGLNFGERKFGERYSQAMDDFGLDYQTLRNYVWVARSVPMSLRRDSVPYSHYKEIASLVDDAPDVAEEILDRIEGERLTVKQTRSEVRVAKSGLPPATEDGIVRSQLVLCPTCHGAGVVTAIEGRMTDED